MVRILLTILIINEDFCSTESDVGYFNGQYYILPFTKNNL